MTVFADVQLTRASVCQASAGEDPRGEDPTWSPLPPVQWDMSSQPRYSPREAEAQGRRGEAQESGILTPDLRAFPITVGEGRWDFIYMTVLQGPITKHCQRKASGGQRRMSSQ